MSRAATGDTVVIKPVNNIYTVLSGVALVVVILAVIPWRYVWQQYVRADQDAWRR
jgi:hypothetical protein